MDIKVLQLHKRASTKYEYIQDRYSIAPSKDIVALADGTTQSFKSENWAKFITERFVKNPLFKKDELTGLFKLAAKELENYSFNYSSNPAKASLEKAKKKKGSTATFLGVEITSGEKFKAVFCGDTNLFKIGTEKGVVAFPFSDVDSLDCNSNFINTNDLLKNEFDASAFVIKEFQWSRNDKLILATDALSRLILKEPQILTDLLAISSFNELLTYCMDKWDNKLLEEDDISAIIITNNGGSSIVRYVPPSDFSFPEEKETEFVPTSLLKQSDPNELSDMEINQLMNQFRGVANDFDQIRQKLRFHQLLLIAAVFLLIFNLAFTYIFSKKENSNDSLIHNTEKQSLEHNVDLLTAERNDLLSRNKALQAEISKLKSSTASLQEKDQKREAADSIHPPSKPKTEEEKKAFQKKVGLIPDGKWGPQSERAWNQQQMQ